MHWADVVASKLDGKQIVSTGISPSGEIHVGNMREVLTGDIVFRALRDAGKEAQFYYEADDMDPLRKVPKGIDESFSRYIGMPLYKIPAPDGKHVSWSSQFIEPFIETLKIVGVDLNFLYTHELYEKGLFNDLIRKSFDEREKIAAIISEVSGRTLTENYYPFDVLCDSCGRIDKTEITGYQWPEASYECKACGHTGRRDIRNGGGKLPWRVEWPAKWIILGVTVEPFGKDHAAAGGSYDTGKRIIEDVFERQAPFPVVYEWILLRKLGAMHSSKGILIKSLDMARMAPPEILRFLIAKNNPERHIEMDAQSGLISLVNEYDKYERIYFGKEEAPDQGRVSDIKRIYELSQLGSPPKDFPVQVSFNHLINLVQVKGGDEQILESLRNSSFDLTGDITLLQKRIEAVRYWLRNFAKNEFVLTLLDKPRDMEMDPESIKFLRILSGKLYDGMSPEEVNAAIHESCPFATGDKQRCFTTLYNIFLGKNTGPRLGYLFTSIGIPRTREFLNHYIH